MTRLPAIPGEDFSELGPAMQRLTVLQRQFVVAYCEHPNYTPGQLAAEAGYSAGTEGSTQLRVVGFHMMRNEKVLAAINEEAGKRLRGAGLIGVGAVVAIALNPAHKDHLKAALALMDRTGHHATSEHKVTVDDKRPQSKAELVAAVAQVARDAGLTDDAIKKLTGGDIVDAEFQDVTAQTELDAQIAAEMEDL